MPIEDIDQNKNVIIEQNVNIEKSATPQKSSDEDLDLTKWTVQPLV